MDPTLELHNRISIEALIQWDIYTYHRYERYYIYGAIHQARITGSIILHSPQLTYKPFGAWRHWNKLSNVFYWTNQYISLTTASDPTELNLVELSFVE
jgi:hypothetical protein